MAVSGRVAAGISAEVTFMAKVMPLQKVPPTLTSTFDVAYVKEGSSVTV